MARYTDEPIGLAELKRMAVYDHRRDVYRLEVSAELMERVTVDTTGALEAARRERHRLNSDLAAAQARSVWGDRLLATAVRRREEDRIVAAILAWGLAWLPALGLLGAAA